MIRICCGVVGKCSTSACGVATDGRMFGNQHSMSRAMMKQEFNNNSVQDYNKL